MEDLQTISTPEARTNETIEEKRKSFWPLVFNTLLVIVVCLTGFNFYLFCWLWSSLSVENSSNVASSASSSMFRSNQWARIDTLSSWNSIKINGRMTNLKDLEVDRMLAGEGRLFLSSRNSIQMMNNADVKPLLEILMRENRIQFPKGLIVDGGDATTRLKIENLHQQQQQQHQNKRMKLECDQKTAKCLVESPKIKLSSRRGVDFNRKSAQTPKIATNRLHSPTNWLNLLSTNSSLFETKVGQIQLMALDELSLFSHNSAVILDADKIDVSRIGGFKNGVDRLVANTERNSFRDRKLYKLCICLPSNRQDTTTTSRDQLWRNSSNDVVVQQDQLRLDLVFAVRSQLNCFKFSASFCNQQQIAPMN